MLMSGEGCGPSGGDALQEASGQTSQGILLIIILLMFVPVIEIKVYFIRVKVVFISITGSSHRTSQQPGKGHKGSPNIMLIPLT